VVSDTEVFDRRSESLALIGFDPALAQLGILGVDHECPSDIAAVAAKQAEDVAGGEQEITGLFSGQLPSASSVKRRRI
jgi:hypothetical protein